MLLKKMTSAEKSVKIEELLEEASRLSGRHHVLKLDKKDTEDDLSHLEVAHRQQSEAYLYEQGRVEGMREILQSALPDYVRRPRRGEVACPVDRYVDDAERKMIHLEGVVEGLGRK